MNVYEYNRRRIRTLLEGGPVPLSEFRKSVSTLAYRSEFLRLFTLRWVGGVQCAVLR